MRPLPTIDADLKAARSRVAALQREHTKAWVMAKDAAIRAFDAGVDVPHIAEDLGLNPKAVHGVLWRAGRTRKKRSEACRQFAKPVVGQAAAVAQGVGNAATAAAPANGAGS